MIFEICFLLFFFMLYSYAYVQKREIQISHINDDYLDL